MNLPDHLSFIEVEVPNAVDLLIAECALLGCGLTRADAALALMSRRDFDRFATYVDYDLTGDGCWHWQGALDPEGYGIAHVFGETVRAHRVGLRVVDDLPPMPGLVADHVCHNRDLTCPGGPTCLHRRCVRPSHLDLVTPVVNARTGRGGAAQRARTNCPAGHAYDGINSRGHRVCRTCERESKRRSSKRRRVSDPASRPRTQPPGKQP